MDCAKAWGKTPPAIFVADKSIDLPPYAHPVVFMDKDGDPGVLADHYYDWGRPGPAARVYVDDASELNSGPYSVSEAASHEIVEALIDPQINLWVDHPRLDMKGYQMALEIADMVQDTYQIDVPGIGLWLVSNFVYPDYFKTMGLYHHSEELTALDHLGTIRVPGEIGPDGYAIIRRPNPNSPGYEYSSEYPHGMQVPSFSSRVMVAKSHPMSRTTRRGYDWRRDLKKTDLTEESEEHPNRLPFA